MEEVSSRFLRHGQSLSDSFDLVACHAPIDQLPTPAAKIGLFQFNYQMYTYTEPKIYIRVYRSASV